MTVKLKTPSNGSVSLTPQDTAADVVLTVPSGGTGSQLAVADSSGYTYSGGLVVSPQTGFKNRIINGDMRIDERNAGASVTPTATAYTLDRWNAIMSAASKYSVQRSTTAPAGFINSIIITSTSAYSVGASDSFNIAQFVEGLNIADLGWGTANAKPITISFWVRSSLTGTFGGVIQNDGNSRSYPFAYTISSSNTWEYKTITVAGDTTGTWLTTNGIGLKLRFSIGTGATLSGTAGSWAGADYRSATGAISVVGTNGATWYVTGVQVEVGTVATPFEFRSIGQELILCQRYYERSNFVVNAAGQSFQNVFYKATKRVAPTLSVLVGSVSPAFLNSRATDYFTVDGLASINSGVTVATSAEL